MTTEHTPADTPAARTDALERELEEHGHIHHEDVDAAIVAREMARETGDGPSPALGATIVARAGSSAASGAATSSASARQTSRANVCGKLMGRCP